MANTGFNFQKFLDDSRKTLLAPKEYFSSMPKEGGFVEPLIKAVIYGVIAGILYLIWGLLNLTPGAGMFGGMAGGAAGIGALIGTVIGAVIGLFVGGVIILIISAICGGSTNYEANVRATAAMMVLMPVNAVLAFTYGITLWLGMIVGIVVGLYGIWIMYNALTSALGAKEGPAKIVSIILAALLALSLLSSLMCAKGLQGISEKALKDSGQTEQDVQKAIKMFNKAAEDMKKAAEEK